MTGHFLAILGTAALLATASAASAAPAPRQIGAGSDWAHYGGDNGYSKYSRLSQIDTGNVTKLGIAWRWSSPDNAINARDIPDSSGGVARTSGFRATPLAIGGTLYTRTSFSMAAAIDGATGATLWTFDPEAYRRPRPAIFGHTGRGIAQWGEGSQRRIVLMTNDGRLFALSAATGKPIAGFGTDGNIDVGKLMRFPHSDRPVPVGMYSFNAVPLICADTIIVGQSMSRGEAEPGDPLAYPIYPFPDGDVFGFDVRTGKLLWTFHGSPRAGEPGFETWDTPTLLARGKANVWTNISCDDASGTAYLPVSAANGIINGVQRPGDNLYSQSIVALAARTGKRRWHYQLSHHDVWDYDPPAAPVVFDTIVEGRPVKGVVVVGKTAFAYVFDRLTGKPVWPIIERPVPASKLAGERSSPTQPFPTKPPAFDTQTPITDDMVIDLTPALKADALALLAKHGRGTLFEPPGPVATIAMPGIGGGANWGGAAFDPETSRLFVPSMTVPTMIGLSDLAPGSPGFGKVAYNQRRVLAEIPNNIPPVKPPYTRVTALDLSAGTKVWQTANGKGFNRHPALAGLNLPPLGSNGISGILATKTLVFSADRGNQNGPGPGRAPPQIRAFDKATGAILWEHDLPATYWGASPMTYERAGRQYLVIAVGGDDVARPGVAGTPSELIAFALPATTR